MAFGKKKAATVQFDQSNVVMLASQALAEKRATLVRLPIRLTGETPLLMQQWSQKAILQMVGKMVGLPVPQVSKNLNDDYEASYYRNDNDEIALPCRIVKAAIVAGAIDTGGVTSKAELKRGLRVLGYTTPIRIKRPMAMDCRIVKNSNGSPDMRARAVIAPGYHFDVVLQFNTGLTPDKVMAAVEGAGSAIGICEWRPEKGGDFGTFSVKALPDKEIERIINECSVPEKTYEIPPEYLRSFDPSKSPDAARKALAVVSHVNGQSKRTKKSALIEANGAT